MSLRELTKNTFILALPKVITFVLKLARAKLNAVFLGTEGLGIVNQLQEVIKKLGGFSTLSLNVGAKKLIVEFDKDKQRKIEIPKIVGIFGLITLLFVGIFFIAGLFFLEELSNYFLKDQPKGLFLTAFLVFPLVTLRTVPKTTLSSLMEFKTISKTEIFVTVSAFITYVPLIIIFGIQGAVANIVITNILFFAAFSYFAFYKAAKKRGQQLISFKKLKIDKSTIREFVSISSATSVLGLYAIFCQLTIRGILASNLGMEKIGVYAPLIAWSGFFYSFFIPALIQYIFPKYGNCETNDELKSVANDGFRLVSFIILPFVIIMIAFREIFIPVFYSKDFLEASVYLPLHFIGIFFWTWMSVLKQILIPTGRIKQYIPFFLAEFSLYLLVIFTLVKEIGLWSWTLRYSFIPLILFLAYLIYLAKAIRFRIFLQNALLMGYGLIASGITYFLTFTTENLYLIRGGVSVILITGLYFFMKKNEKSLIFQYIKQYTKKNKRKK